MNMYEVREKEGLFAIYLGDRFVGLFAQSTANLIRDVLNRERERVVKYLKPELKENGISTEAD